MNRFRLRARAPVSVEVRINGSDTPLRVKADKTGHALSGGAAAGLIPILGIDGFVSHEEQCLAAAVSTVRANECGAFGWPPGQLSDPQSMAVSGRSCLRRDWYGPLIGTRRERLYSVKMAPVRAPAHPVLRTN